MSWQERVDQYSKTDLPKKEVEEGQKKTETEEASLRVLEQLKVGEKLLQIKDEIWHMGEVTPLKGPSYGDGRITLYDRWIKPSGRSYQDWDGNEHYETFIAYREPILSVAALRIGHDEINGDKFLVGVLTNYHVFNNVVHKPENRDLPYNPWVWWLVVSEFKLPQAEKKIEEFLAKDCFNRQKSSMILSQAQKVSETEAALVSGMDIPAEFRYLQELTKKGRLKCYKRPLGECPVSVDLYIWEEYRKWAEYRLLRRGEGYNWTDSSRFSGGEWADAGEIYVETRERANKKPGEIEIVPGESVVKDGVELTVTKIERLEKNAYHYKGDRIKAWVLLKNLSDDARSFGMLNFTLQTAEGQIISPRFDVWDTEKALKAGGQLVKGGQVEGNMVFEFPEEEGYQYIIWQDYSFNILRQGYFFCGDKIYIRV